MVAEKGLSEIRAAGSESLSFSTVAKRPIGNPLAFASSRLSFPADRRFEREARISGRSEIAFPAMVQALIGAGWGVDTRLRRQAHLLENGNFLAIDKKMV
jgi:hypothetical protein